MAQPLETGRSTPGYALRWLFGVLLGSLIRLGLWVIPESFAKRAMERVLP